VAVQLPNVPNFLLAYFGIIKAGLVMAPVKPLVRADEVSYHLSDSQAQVLVTHESFATEAATGAEKVGDVSVFVVNLPGSDQRPDGARSFDRLCEAEDTGEIVPVGAEDTAVLLYTSGTTGKPKGAELTHFELYMNCTVAGELFGFSEDDVSLAVLPLFHVFGLSSVLNIAVRFGGALVLVPQFEPGAVLNAIERRRCTILPGVPTMYFALLNADSASGRDFKLADEGDDENGNDNGNGRHLEDN
jgi:long-chain acyl-CoA synthetase